MYCAVCEVSTHQEEHKEIVCENMTTRCSKKDHLMCSSIACLS